MDLRILFVFGIISNFIITIGLYYQVKNKKIKFIEGNKKTSLDTVQEYLLSFILFTLFATIGLVLYPFIYRLFSTLSIFGPLERLGILSVFTGVVIIVCVELLYLLIIVAMNKGYDLMSVHDDHYTLNNNEKKAIYLIICFLLSLFYGFVLTDTEPFDHVAISGFYIVLLLGALFWLIPRYSDYKAFWTFCKTLPALFYGSVSIILQIMIFQFFSNKADNKDLAMLLSVLGITVGFFAAYALIILIKNLKNNPDPLNEK